MRLRVVGGWAVHCMASRGEAQWCGGSAPYVFVDIGNAFGATSGREPRGCFPSNSRPVPPLPQSNWWLCALFGRGDPPYQWMLGLSPLKR